MTTLDLTAPERTPDARTARPGDAVVWVCDNCSADNGRVRKRCGECGTSRD